MTEAEDARLYKPRTPRQHQFFLQLETACDMDDWIERWLPRGEERMLAHVRDFEGTPHRLEITPQFQRGIRKIIFTRLMDLTDAGHGREAMYIVVGWRAKPPYDPLRQGGEH
jgi:hypothetical protein